MRSFVINLARAGERLRRFMESASGHGWDVERFEAIDAGDLRLDPNADGTVCARHASAPEIRVSSANPWGDAILPGEVACALSHMSLWRDLLESGEEVRCIFEDDAIIEGPNDLPPLPEDAEFVFISDRVGCLLPDEISDEAGFWKWAEAHPFAPLVPGCGTEAYLVTKSGAAKGLKLLRQMFMPIDLQLMVHAHGTLEADHEYARLRQPGLPTCRIYATLETYTKHGGEGVSYVRDRGRGLDAGACGA